MSPEISEFLAKANRIRGLEEAEKDARRKPFIAGNDFDRITLNRHESYSSRQASGHAVAAAGVALKRARMEVLAEAEAQRDADLAAIAAELESLRAVLPSLAAKASIAIGDWARSLKSEVL